MNKLDLVNAVSEACSISKKDADAAITALLLEVGKALERKEEVKLSGFGTFLVKDRKGRVGTIPGTNTKINIPNTKTVAFKPSKQLKELVK
ncbi:MAG: HU family DNA-binding protein [Candidatus Onthovivens sp.]|nr:HU family DNA-binding protein [Mollicutes bacterium]MDD6468549.1 HU family DNA-binding protein [Bacilli bacterium]MDY2724315.1 HU family DNA-binding protein [Candidatus Onthovivens sp.]MCI6615390.1 HU family DNA-binding protein [Mollicutes bacterium]MCI7039978.1 HU family DNA-binding protein [Mollicutes bacterium]